MENQNKQNDLNDPLCPDGAPEFLKSVPVPQGDDFQIVAWLGYRNAKGFLYYRQVPVCLTIPDGMIGDPAGSMRKTLMDVFQGVSANPFLRLIHIVTESPREELDRMLYVPPVRPVAPRALDAPVIPLQTNPVPYLERPDVEVAHGGEPV